MRRTVDLFVLETGKIRCCWFLLRGSHFDFNHLGGGAHVGEVVGARDTVDVVVVVVQVVWDLAEMRK